MAKRNQIERDMPISSTLVKTREEVKKLLEEQISAAQLILNIQVSKKQIPQVSYDMFGVSRSYENKYDKEQQDELFRQYHIWDNRCKEIFVRSFVHPNNTDLEGYNRTGNPYFYEDAVEEQKKLLRDKITYIKGFIDRLDLIPCDVVHEVVIQQDEQIVDRNKVFIVHGHNTALRVEVARTIELLGLKAIILQEQEDFGNTIIEKFEDNTTDIGFAVILITGDDIGTSKKEIEKENDINRLVRLRARQNVVFEMGYFIGKLDRAHVFELMEEGVEAPSDLSGMLYTVVDKEGMWKVKLAKRLKAVGYSVNIDAII